MSPAYRGRPLSGSFVHFVPKALTESYGSSLYSLPHDEHGEMKTTQKLVVLTHALKIDAIAIEMLTHKPLVCLSKPFIN
jgi:hypothetical protein